MKTKIIKMETENTKTIVIRNVNSSIKGKPVQY